MELAANELAGGVSGDRAGSELDVRLALGEAGGPEGRTSGAASYRWDLQPGHWTSLGTHRGVGEQGEVGRGDVGVGRSGRADAPSSSGSRI